MTLFPLSEIRDHPEGKTCKTCAYKFRKPGHTRNYYKCAIKGDTNSEATDIRLKDPGCSRHLDEVFKYQVYPKWKRSEP